MKITENQLRKLIREEIETESSFWKQSPRGSSFYHTDETDLIETSGDYLWDPTIGTLSYRPWGRRAKGSDKLSREVSPRRAGGFENIRTEEQATERVLQHKKRKMARHAKRKKMVKK